MNPIKKENAPLDTERSLVTSRARVETGTGGAISVSRSLGLTVVKTAEKVGRYTVQAVDSSGASVPLAHVMGIDVAIISPTADAAITAGAATDWTIRALSEANGLFYLQFLTRADTTDGLAVTVVNADAELEDNSKFILMVQSVRNEVQP
jgi:Zn-dependent alcohol dehydrogenase